jgi:uncharacterized protein YndB with AHSA1/START domain
MNSDAIANSRLVQDGGDWVLVVERVLDHPNDKVWAALTEAEQIPSWGPFTTDRDLTAPGPVTIVHIGMPDAEEMQAEVLEVNAPHLLVFRWGPDILRWELTDAGERTALVLRHRFVDRQQAPSYAAGWHLCLDGLTGALAGEAMPSMVGQNAVNYGWRELYAQYAEALDVPPS